MVTFNYDRYLEQYLGVALRESYMLDDSAIRTQLATLRFIHVYGTIGGRPSTTTIDSGWHSNNPPPSDDGQLPELQEAPRHYGCKGRCDD